MVSGAGGGGAGSAKIDQDGWSSYGNHTWTVPVHLKGDRIYIRMLGAGGGGGGVDQGGGGGGASGGVWEGNYDIPINQDKMEVVIGEGGHGGYYVGTNPVKAEQAGEMVQTVLQVHQAAAVVVQQALTMVQSLFSAEAEVQEAEY